MAGAKRRKRDLGLCEHWGCRNRADIIIHHPQIETPFGHRLTAPDSLICAYHWDEKRGDIPSLADVVADGSALFTFDVIGQEA